MGRIVALTVALLAALTAGCTSGSDSNPPAASSAGPSSAPAATSNPPSTTKPVTASQDWPTYHGDLQRTGVSRAMPAASGRLTATKIALDGQVYASPIVVGGTVIVATERNVVYGLARPVGSAGGSPWVFPPTGMTCRAATSTRSASPARRSTTPPRTVFLVASIGARVVTDWSRSTRRPARSAGGARWTCRGVDARRCSSAARSPCSTAGSGSPSAAWPVTAASTRAGWSASRSATASRSPTPCRPPGRPGSGRRPAPRAHGHLLVAVGNGESVGGSYDFSDSVLELAGTRLVDSFSPSTWAADNAADLDLGSQGPAVVGTKWIFIAGKSGTAYVLRAGDLGGIGGQHSQAELCRSFGGTAVAGTTVYVPCADGLRAVRIDQAGGILEGWRAAESITGSPVLGGGRLYSVSPEAGVLNALDPATGKIRERVPVGRTSRFATPAISGTRLFVPTLAGITIVDTAAR